MGTIELKSNIHKLIDKIHNERLLQAIHDFLSAQEKNDESGRIWSTLSEEQKREVLISFEESEDENNLIDSKDIFKNI